MKRRKEDPMGVPEWVLTYGDMMSLLLCFFILLAAFSELKQEREYRKVYEEVKEALGFEGGFGVARIFERSQNSSIRNQEELAKAAENKMNTDETTQTTVPGERPRVASREDAERQVMDVPLDFEVGSIDISPSNLDRLRIIAQQIKDQRFLVYIRGHAYGSEDWTDAQLPDAEALGFERARAVRAVLVRDFGVDPSILRLVTCGSQEPVAKSTTSTQEHYRNRRVEVVRSGETP